MCADDRGGRASPERDAAAAYRDPDVGGPPPRYSVALRAVGGAAPYAWSVVAGTLPAGLSLNPRTGVLSGTPTRRGTARFTVRVAGQATAARSFTLTVN